jgi:hypothetical protein
MSDTSTRVVQLGFSGDVNSQIIQSALENNVTPNVILKQTLTIGDNTISAPVVPGIVVTGLTIIPPAGNITLMVLKGNVADIGIPMHLTDWTSLSLDPTFISLVINVAAQVDGVLLIWT